LCYKNKTLKKYLFWVTFRRLAIGFNWWLQSKVTPIRYENLILLFEKEIG